jgi:cellulose synthase/poly-beta-1,6-N-acetylglucosamine synthase-like glycosyltransferase
VLGLQEVLLSIVVPTKNRPETLSVLIETVLSWDVSDIELVVEDNSDCNRELLERIGVWVDDDRLRYV